MKAATAQFSRITTRLNDGTARLSIRAPSPNTLLLALILGPALLIALRSL